MGDSAGGGLALLSIQSIISQNMEKPRAAVLISPWTDLTLSGDSYKRNCDVDAMLSVDQVVWMIKNVIRVDQDTPQLHSPLFGSLKDFPPLYISFGTTEILEDDSRQLVAKAKAKNVDLTEQVGIHLMHVYPLMFDYYPEARQSLHRMQQWIEKKFK